jgi:Patatin-like phospholipase
MLRHVRPSGQEGGAVNRIALVSAISVPEDRGYQVRRVVGTSAGAIVGSLVAANAGLANSRRSCAELTTGDSWTGRGGGTCSWARPQRCWLRA